MSSGPGADLPRAWRGRDIGGWAEFLGVPSFELFEALPSTNDRLRELAAGGAAPLTTIIAETQSRGRGRSGRSWNSPAGSGLWISVLLATDPRTAGVLPLAVGVATAFALERFAGLRLELKWPNDVLVHERKVAGILCESTGDGRDGIVVGIGINLRRPSAEIPAELLGTMAFLEDVAGGPVPEPELTRILVEEIRRWVQPGPALVRERVQDAWSERDCLRGKNVRTDDGRSGIGLGISSDGALELGATNGETIRVRSGGVRVDEAGGHSGSSALHLSGAESGGA